MSKEQKGYEGTCICSWHPCHHTPNEKRQSDFDRVTAERDAARETLENSYTAEDHERLVAKGQELNVKYIENLEKRLAAADERADLLEGLLLLWMSPVQRTMAGRRRLVERTDAALKPAEGQRNQCDGCRAGIPIVNGAHRMGKADGYPDTMSCTAKLYKP